MRKKTGDTLVEVTLAIGIFSMVAVAVVTVVNNSTSRVQTALETTLTREEIDAQAEAIRYIQNAYTNFLKSPNDDDFIYAKAWYKIIKYASAVGDFPEGLSYKPQTCDELYEESNLANADGDPRVFVVDPQNGDYYDLNFIVKYPLIGPVGADTPPDRALFQPTTTYPNLIYSTGGKDRDYILYVNGIYVVAVKGGDSFIGFRPEPSPTYYDFYIRTCWYGIGAKIPSTISTVIRLANPEYLITPPDDIIPYLLDPSL